MKIKMKKFWMLLVLMPLLTLADTEVVDGISWTYHVGDGKASINGAEPSTGSITIPSTLGGCQVTYINDRAFSDCTGLTSVTIPEGVTYIWSRAFEGCSGLTTVTIPSSMTYICDRAFSDCTGLTSVTIPDGVTDIWSGAFSGCSGLTSVMIPSSVTGIGESAFSGCSGLTSVTISEGVTGIGGGAFYGCSSLTTMTIPSSVTYIGDAAFRGCSGLTSVMIPEGVTCIWDLAFYGCSGLTSVTIPSSVPRIGESAFSGCKGLTTVTISEGVTSIGQYAFEGCSGLASVTIPSSVTYISEYAFRGTKMIDDHPDGPVIVDNCLLAYKGDCPSTVEIPVGVRLIADRAFRGCSGLTSVTIPSSVMSIGALAFSGCSGLMSVTIPPGVTSIRLGAFSVCSGLTSVAIPLSVTSIGQYAFDGCSGLTSVTIPSSVTSIGEGAFDRCELLKTIHVGKDGDIDNVRQMLVVSGFDVTGVTFDYVELPVATNTITYLGLEGAVNTNVTEFTTNDLPLVLGPVEREGWTFLGWTPNGGVIPEGTMSNVTFTAQWEKEVVEPQTVVAEAETHVDVAKGEKAPYEDAAAVYDGYLYDGEKVVGSVQVKVAKGKVDKKSGKFEAKVTATVQLADGSKKLSFKGGIADETGAITEMTDKNGNKLAVTVGVKGLGGTFRRAGGSAPYQIDGARNVFSGKSDADKSAAEKAMQAYMATYNVAFDGGTLSVVVGKKGKVKVSGTVDGNKVSATSQLVVGDGAAVVPVVIVKKVNLSFCLWLDAKGEKAEVRGATVGASSPRMIAGNPGPIASGAKFWLDEAAVGKMKEWLKGLYADYLPKGLAVAQSGTKWTVADGDKAGKLVLDKATGALDLAKSKITDNTSGLKLTYKEKDGTFKGSFKVYNLESGKIKSYTANVTGVMIGSTGYGTATIKKLGTVAVTIE